LGNLLEKPPEIPTPLSQWQCISGKKRQDPQKFHITQLFYFSLFTKIHRFRTNSLLSLGGLLE